MEIRALSRAAQILATVNSAPAGATLSEIVGDVSLSKATTYRFLQALLKMEFLRIEPESATYHIGPALLRLGRFAMQHEDLRSAARPFLEELKETTGETLMLVVAAGPKRLTLDAVLSDHELRAVPEIGAMKPIYAGAAGKAMLAWYSKPDLQNLFEGLALRAVTQKTITSIESLERDFSRIRQRGYATSIGETVFGQAASAAPIFGHDGAVVGSLNVSGPAVRMPASRLASHGEIVAAAALRLSKKLGWKKKAKTVTRRK